MAREVQLDHENVILKLNGTTVLLALKLSLNIPYSTIKRVYVDDFKASQWALRMPGTTISPLIIRMNGIFFQRTYGNIRIGWS